MPQPYFKSGRFPRERGLTLAAAAADHLLLGYYCVDCRRLTWFLASDLVQIFNPRLGWYYPLFSCGKCGSIDSISVRQRLPESGDYGNLPVRRPAGIRYTQLWANVTLGEDPRDLGYPTREMIREAAAGLRRGGLLDEEQGPFLRTIVEGFKVDER